jgi:hypothetical protein
MAQMIKVTIYENDTKMRWADYSGQECAALEDCIYELFEHYCKDKPIEFRLDVDDDDYEFGILSCIDMNENKMIPFPNEIFDALILPNKIALIGERIIIKPPQYGLSPWSSIVQVLFTPLPM